jgi:hypothetical protein
MYSTLDITIFRTSPPRRLNSTFSYLFCYNWLMTTGIVITIQLLRFRQNRFWSMQFTWNIRLMSITNSAFTFILFVCSLIAGNYKCSDKKIHKLQKIHNIKREVISISSHIWWQSYDNWFPAVLCVTSQCFIAWFHFCSLSVCSTINV